MYAALATPRRKDSNAVDLGAELELVDFVCRGGVDGLVLLGSTGEFVHFDIHDRIRLAQFAVKRSRVPVAVNVSHSTLEGALTLARQSVSYGASALLLMPPYFFRYSQADIEEFCMRFAKELGPAVPLLLYNIPAFTNELQFETVMRLLATGLYAGIKDSSGRMDEFRRMNAVKKQAPFNLLIGNDQIFAEARAEGADGGISGVATAVPELLVSLDRAIQTGSEQKRAGLEARLQQFIAQSERFPFPFAIKEAITLRGIKTGPPAVVAANEEVEAFREWCRAWLPVVLKETAGG
jgi:4-hydroxy-tetrahydrodipicolinate synthase